MQHVYFQIFGATEACSDGLRPSIHRRQAMNREVSASRNSLASTGPLGRRQRSEYSVQVGIGLMVNRIVTLNIARRTGNYKWSIRQRRSLFRSFAVNSEPLHNGNERGSVQSQPA